MATAVSLGALVSSTTPASDVINNALTVLSKMAASAQKQSGRTWPSGLSTQAVRCNFFRVAADTHGQQRRDRGRVVNTGSWGTPQ